MKEETYPDVIRLRDTTEDDVSDDVSELLDMLWTRDRLAFARELVRSCLRLRREGVSRLHRRR